MIKFKEKKKKNKKKRGKKKMTQEWVRETERCFNQKAEYHHSEIKDLALLSHSSAVETRYFVNFRIANWELPAWLHLFEASGRQHQDPNASAYFKEHIAPFVTKVRAFLEYFPEDKERTTRECGICGVKLLPDWRRPPQPDDLGKAHYEHFIEAHFSGSTVKSALKRV